MYGYYGEDSVCLRFKVKADSIEDASSMADGYEVKSVSECGEDLKGVYDVEVALKPKDLEKLFGNESGSVASAYRMVKAANEKRKAEMKAECGGPR